MNDEERTALEVPFSEVEIKEAVWGCGGMKSLGPDGYKFFFIIKCWHFLKEDFLSFFYDFHNNLVLSKAITTSLLTLILKKSIPSGLDN